MSVEEVVESKQQIVKRQISWAIAERLKTGKRLGAAAVMHEAKVPRNHPWVGEMARELIANSNELWPSESSQLTGDTAAPIDLRHCKSEFPLGEFDAEMQGSYRS